MKVGIIGLGLMGGSLALSLKKLPFITGVVGHDHNKEHQAQALELNLVDDIVDFESIKKCDIIVLGIPVNGIIAVLQELKDVPKETTIIDLGSTKEIIIKALPPEIRQNFVAVHPMTGTEYSGPEAAFEDLYKDKVVVLCDLAQSGTHQQEIAVRIFSGIHMELHYMHAHEHDRHAAFISHLPHAISYALANTVLSQEKKEDILALAAGGFRSMSRLAKSSPYMWEDIFKQNAGNLLESIELFELELARLKKDIKNEDWPSLHEKMIAGNKLQDIFS